MFTQQSVIALMLAAIAGLSTLAGAAVVLITGKRNDSVLTLALGFAAGVMLSACFTDLLPEGEEYMCAWAGETKGLICSIAFVVVGVILAVLADKAIPDGCHCHDEHHHHDHNVGIMEHCSGEISRVGIMSMLAVGLHNFPEGIALYFAGNADAKLGIILTIAVILHNIPSGITIAAPIYYSSGSKVKAFFCTLIPSLIQPAGALLACLVLKNVMNDFVMGMMFSLVAGILLFLALVELYPMARSYGHTKAGTVAMFVGVLLMPLTHLMH